MLQVNPCRRPIWKAFTLMIRIRRLQKLRAPLLSHRRVVSVVGRQSISSKTSVTCYTAVVPCSTSAVDKLSCPIARSRNRSCSPNMNQKDCSPQSTLCQTTRVFLSRKILARKERAVVLKPPNLSDHKVQACGQASCNQNTLISYISQKPQSG